VVLLPLVVLLVLLAVLMPLVRCCSHCALSVSC
jgi:hypothetical protein